MAVSIVVFLYLYYAFLAGWSLFALASVYHMMRYGVRGVITVFSTLIFLGGSIAMLYISYDYINQVDWSVEFSIFEDTININEIKF